jgi:hypothetical protein
LDRLEWANVLDGIVRAPENHPMLIASRFLLAQRLEAAVNCRLPKWHNGATA